MKSAAVALILGRSDPLGLLAASPQDAAVELAVLEEAQRLRTERDEWQIEQTATLIANRLGPVIVSCANAIIRQLGQIGR